MGCDACDDPSKCAECEEKRDEEKTPEPTGEETPEEPATEQE